MLKLYCLAVSPPLPARLAAMGVLLSVFHSSFTDGSRLKAQVLRFVWMSKVLRALPCTKKAKARKGRLGNTALP